MVEELGLLKKEGGMGAACRDGRGQPPPPSTPSAQTVTCCESKWGSVPVCQASRDAIVTGGASAILVEVMRPGLKVRPIQKALGALCVRLFALRKRATQAAVQVRQLRP